MSLPGRHNLTPYVGDAFRCLLRVDTEAGVTVDDGAGSVTVSVGVIGVQGPPGTVVVADDEPTDAPTGTLWADTSED